MKELIIALIAIWLPYLTIVLFGQITWEVLLLQVVSGIFIIAWLHKSYISKHNTFKDCIDSEHIIGNIYEK